MLLLNAVKFLRTVFPADNIVCDSDDIEFGTLWWFVYAGISCLLVLFAGIMSGLTLGLMSLSLVELEILQRSGTFREKKQAGLLSSKLHFLLGGKIRCCMCICKWKNELKLIFPLLLIMLIIYPLSDMQLLFHRLSRNNTSCLSLCFFVMRVPWRYLQFVY